MIVPFFDGRIRTESEDCNYRCRFQDEDFTFQQPLPAEPDGSSRSEPQSWSSTNPFKNMKNYVIRILPNPGPRQTKITRKAISSPTNFDHVMHVGFDPDTGEFTGMPDDWARLLKSSKIDVNEIKQAPDTVIAVSSVSIPCQWYKYFHFLGAEILRGKHGKRGRGQVPFARQPDAGGKNETESSARNFGESSFGDAAAHSTAILHAT